MKASNILLTASPVAVAIAASAPMSPAPASEFLFSNPDPATAVSSGFKIPTSYESAIMARRILALAPFATFSTVFPSDKDGGIGGAPVGLTDYIADCEDDSVGNPTILELHIGTSFRNVRSGSNISVSLAWVPPYPPSRRIRSAPSSPSLLSALEDSLRSLLGLSRRHEEQAGEGRPDPQPYSGANLPRFSLLGYLEKIEPSKVAGVTTCYVGTHPDAKYWLPGNPIHEAEWVRLVVTKVYWIGGFGDRAYIGWIPVDEYSKVTRDEWEAIRLPGEKPDWKEWSMRELGDL
ncbi:hypothetical protein RB597_009163 [Gaeumannomyces tritici]